MRSQRGFTLVEALVGMVVGGMVMAGAFRVWKTHQEEGFRLQKKNELRDRMALSSKHIQRSITLAGLGMENAPTMVRADEVGSDTLIIYTNPGESRTGLTSNPFVGQYTVFVENAALFEGVRYLALSDTSKGEVKPIERIQGSIVVLSKPLERAYDKTITSAFPAKREKYYTEQEARRLIRTMDGSTNVLGEDMHNFQVSFRDKKGASTNEPALVRSVHFSFTGIFPAREGALNSLLFTSTAIPRNML